MERTKQEQKQKDTLERSVNLYGVTNLGIARILTKVFVKRLLRHTIYEDEKIYNDWQMEKLQK